MCSIFASLNCQGDIARHRTVAVAQSGLMQHRGPDSMGLSVLGRNILVHNRIAVVDVFHGGQPIRGDQNGSAVIANAEIYNHRDIRSAHADYAFNTQSDCEAILPAVLSDPSNGIAGLRGMFAFVVVHDEGRRYVIARDRIGILSLYWGKAADGTLHVSSELKALLKVCEVFDIFPPGCYMTETDECPKPYADLQKQFSVSNRSSNPSELKERLIESVNAHLMADVDVGFLLSGGLDSSLIASIGSRLLRERSVSRPKSYAIGLAGSPDLVAARKVADYLSLDHSEYVYTVEEGIDALVSTVNHLESYDVTSIRASVPMHLVARRIRGNGTKVVLTGDGADELFGGYLYFHYAPDGAALHDELVRKLTSMHKYDCLRVNKTMLSWGVEPRVPFLDRNFAEYAMNLDPDLKLPGPGKMEKHLLRSAFEGWLPDEILWRQKEQSSDGVGYGWIDGLKLHAAARISPAQLGDAARKFPLHTPQSQEAYYYREIFEQLFDHVSAAACAPEAKMAGNATEVAARWLGDNVPTDPSGRAVRSIHQHAMPQM